MGGFPFDFDRLARRLEPMRAAFPTGLRWPGGCSLASSTGSRWPGGCFVAPAWAEARMTDADF
jgi:hypothetical protein